MAISGYLNRLKFWTRSVIIQNHPSDECLNSPEYKLAIKLKEYEKYIYAVENIIIWDNPAITLLCILAVNILFWFINRSDWPFIDSLVVIMLSITIYDAWLNHLWPKITGVQEHSVSTPDPGPASPRVISASRTLTHYYENVTRFAEWLCNKRKQQPGSFCFGAVVLFACLYWIGNSLSDLLLAQSLITAALIGPGFWIHCVPPGLKRNVIDHFNCIQKAFNNYGVNDSSDDEYLPVTTSEDYAVLTRASDVQHDTYDSLTVPGSSSDMVSGIAVMPSHEEDSLATISDLEHGFSLPLDHAEDSDSSLEGPNIKLQSDQFSGVSSSDEDSYTNDLKFTEVDEKDSAFNKGLSNLISQAVTSNLTGTIGLLTGVLIPQKTEKKQRSGTADSDLEDYEIIDRDELTS